MESSKLYKLRLSTLLQAVESFKETLSIDLSKFSEKEIDAIKNGQLQKFEYSTELLWKTMQIYIIEQIGEDISGPKPVIKSFFTHNLVDKNTYELLFEMIESRNKAAHIYNKKTFDEIYSRLKNYLKIMEKLVNLLEK